MEHDETSFQAGCQAARADIAAGRLVDRWSGHAGHWGHWIATQLLQRFEVEIHGLGICFVTDASVSFDEGYNKILIAEIDRRHGCGAFQSLMAEAKAQSEENLADAKEYWLERNRLE